MLVNNSQTADRVQTTTTELWETVMGVVVARRLPTVVVQIRLKPNARALVASGLSAQVAFVDKPWTDPTSDLENNIWTCQGTDSHLHFE